MAADDKIVTVKPRHDPAPPAESHRTEFWWFYGVAMGALFVAALILPPVLHSGDMYWPLTLIGAFVITALLSAAAVPHLRHHR